jgi:hypothetical protein
LRFLLAHLDFLLLGYSTAGDQDSERGKTSGAGRAWMA